MNVWQVAKWTLAFFVPAAALFALGLAKIAQRSDHWMRQQCRVCKLGAADPTPAMCRACKWRPA